MKQQSSFKRWLGLVVLSLALAIIIIDTTLLNVSFSTIIKDLNTNIQSLQWVISAYALTLAALTITGGRLGDLYGRKKMFITGAILFAIGSFISSISQNVGTMVAGEAIIEGIGAALMMPATSSLLLANFRGKERAIAFGVWGAVAGSAAAIGPLLGGYLTTNYSWRWGFRINIFVAALVVLGSFIIHESRDTKEKTEMDWLGVLLSSTGLLSFVFGIIEASRYGWWFEKEIFAIGTHTLDLPWNLSVTPVAIALGILLVGLFLRWEKSVASRGHTPLVSLQLFTNRQFTSGALTTGILSLGQAGIFFALPVFLQSVRGLDAFHTGLALLPMPLTLLVVAPLSATLVTRVMPKRMIQVGLLLNSIGYIVLRNSLTIDATARHLAPGLIIFGAGMGLVMSQINNITLSAVPVHEAGEASGVNNTFRQIGTSLGSAIIGAIMLTSLSTNLSTGIHASTVIPTKARDAIAAAATQQTSAVEFGGGVHLGSNVPPAVTNEITTIGHQATVSANHDALLYGVLFSLLGLLASFWLPTVTNLGHEEKSA